MSDMNGGSDSAATWRAFNEGRASWGDWVEARLVEKFGEERSFAREVLGEVIGVLANELRDEFSKALTNLRAQRSLEVVGTYNGSVRYRALDVVALNGASFAARTDDPGPCPGDGWQLIASQGKKGPAGADGRNGRDGKDAPTIVDWAVNRENFTATPVMSNGSRGAVLDLHPLFARFYAQTEGIPEKVEGVP
jgi:hypothetical protein